MIDPTTLAGRCALQGVSEAVHPDPAPEEAGSPRSTLSSSTRGRHSPGGLFGGSKARGGFGPALMGEEDLAEEESKAAEERVEDQEEAE